MKKIIFLFSLLFMPIMCFGFDDACTKPDEYTVDKRCYVTDAQKKEKPYNAVALVLDQDGKDCSGGTVVKKNDKLYLYIGQNADIGCSGYTGKLKVRMPNGGEYVVSYVDSGSWDMDAYQAGLIDVDGEDPSLSGDWAIYEFDKGDVPSYVGISDKLLTNSRKYEYDARAVGYAIPRVMSDKLIEEWKRLYVNYLRKHRNQAISKEEEKKFIKYGTVYDARVSGFVRYMKEYNPNHYNYVYPKTASFMVSKCKYTSNNESVGCQAAQGGLFDSDDALMAISGWGGTAIGGKDHFKVTYVAPVILTRGQKIEQTIKDGVNSAIETAKECVGKLCGGKDEK